MYSANGRKGGPTRETASEKNKISKLICDECGYIEKGRFKEFGELYVCTVCGSEKTHFEKEYE